MSGRDLPNAYHHALVSMLRARTYALGALVDAQDFRRGPAFQRMVERRRAAGKIPEVPEKVRVSSRSLAMGDLNAVCFMTTAHLNLLRRNGAGREVARYCAPLPRASLIEGVSSSSMITTWFASYHVRSHVRNRLKTRKRCRALWRDMLRSASRRNPRSLSAARRMQIFGARAFKARSAVRGRTGRLRFAPWSWSWLYYGSARRLRECGTR